MHSYRNVKGIGITEDFGDLLSEIKKLEDTAF
jgi:hypothetical protein